MEGLPPDLRRRILLRVPLIALAASARGVCRSWRALIDDDPSFARELLSLSPSGYLLHRFRRASPPPPLGDGRPSAALFTFFSAGPPPKPEGETVSSEPTRPLPASYAAVQSLHGLLLVTSGEERLPAYLCNPLLHEWTPLPPQDGPQPEIRDRTEGSYQSGFGFDASADLYKVFRMRRHGNDADLVCEVCAVGRRQPPSGWRRIAGPVGPFDLIGPAVFLGGRLHWIASHEDGSRTVVSLDVRREGFAELRGPPGGGLVGHAVCLGGHLALQVQSKRAAEIWVMEEGSGEAGGWTKRYSESRLYYSMFVLLGLWKEGELLFSVPHGGVYFSYDPATRLLEEVQLGWLLGFHRRTLLRHTPSLVSLRRRGEEEEAARCNRKMHAELLA